MVKAIYFFIDERGENPVKQFIEELPLKDQAKIMAYVDELKRQGHNMHRPMADYLGGGVYELRPRDNRIFYFFYLRGSVVLLHAIRKKTDKIPQEDMALCIKRKRAVETLGNIEKIGS